MNRGLLVLLPRGRAGEIFAGIMAKEVEKFGSDQRLGFGYPFIPDVPLEDPTLLQTISAIIRDAMIDGVTEFVFVDTRISNLLEKVNQLLPEDLEPLIYNPVLEASSFFADPLERPLWLDRWETSTSIRGFQTLYSLDRSDLKQLMEEVFWRTRGVTGGNIENAPKELRLNIVDEEFLRSRSAQLLFKLSEMNVKNGLFIANAELLTALTRYIDEEFRDIWESIKMNNLAKVLALRLI